MSKKSYKLVNYVRKFYTDTSGVVALEAMIIIIPLVFLVLLIAEICSLIYISSAIDSAMGDSMLYSSATSNKAADYKARFDKKMKEQIKYIPLLYNEDKLVVNVRYYSDVNGINNDISSPDPKDHPLALYSVKYNYKPLFLPLPQAMLKDGLNRDMIFIQENQRVRQNNGDK